MSLMQECTDEESRPCRACLTSGRSMYPVGGAADVFTLLASTATVLVDMEEAARVEVCWECHALLRRVRKFRTQVIGVDALLRSVDSSDYYKTASYSLSSLRRRVRVGADFAAREGAALRRCARGEGGGAPDDDYAATPDNVKWEADSGSEWEGEAGRSARPRRAVRRSVKLEPGAEPPPRRRRRTKGTTAKVARPKRAADRIVAVYVDEGEMLRARDEQRQSDEYRDALFKCESCILGFSTQGTYDRHVSSKHAEALGPYQCDVCLCRAGSAPLAAAHRRAHRRLHACPCGAALRSPRAAAQHCAAGFGCKLCGRQFQTERRLRYHRECEHKAAQSCHYCNKQFNNTSTFKRHLLQHTGMPMHECPLCHKSYRGTFGLRAHMRTHAPAASDAFCAECGVQFKSKYIYRHHLRTSARHAPPENFKFPCPHCDKRYFVQSQLTIHVDTVHLRKATHKCDVCGKGFSTIYRVQNHMRSVHERRPVPKTHVCETCGRAFATKQQVTRHQPVHTGERPYACDICEATFRQSAALHTHRRLVHLKIKKSANKFPDPCSEPSG